MRLNYKSLQILPIILLMAVCNLDKNTESIDPPKGIVRVNVKQLAETLVPENLTIQVKTSNGQIVSQYGKFSEFPTNGLPLEPGDYTIDANQTGTKAPAFDTPYYGGSTAFKITGNTPTTVSLTLKQTNFCVGITYSDKFKSENSNYSVKITCPDGSLIYSGTEAKLGYFQSGPLNITVSYTDSKGVAKTSQHTIDATNPNIAPASKLILNIKLPNEGTTTPGTYTGYYQNASGKTGIELKNALTSIISTGYKTQSYDALYTAYKKGDIRTDGTGYIWDVYSDKPESKPAYYFQPDNDRCGTYSKEGDCFNREHCIPQSWFKEASPMVSDYLHILPTDGKVNGERSNFPFGEVATASWTSTNGSKKGTPKSDLGYSSTVFEPIDAYKGDIARIYFYFVTRYADKLSSFEGNGNEIFNSKSYLGLDQWTINMFLRWSKNDPVSDKEKTRNTAAESHQGNRNPFVDHPEFIDMIWGSSTTKSATKKVGYKYVYINVGTTNKR